MPIPLKVLLAEDNSQDADLLILALRRDGFDPDVLRVDTEPDFLEKLKDKPEIVLSDFHMPAFSGFRALELLKQSGLDVPFILVSGTMGEESAVAAMKNGATDYLLKDRLGRLGSAVTSALEETRLRHERSQEAEKHRLTHAQLSQLLEHSPAVLYVLKLDGEKVTPSLVSESVTVLLGFQVAEASSYGWWVGHLHPEDRKRVLEAQMATRALGSSLTEYRMRRKDGSYCWIEDTQRLVRAANGEPIEVLGVWTDITERKKAEGIMQETSRSLERGRQRRMYIEVATLAAMTVTVYLVAYNSTWFDFVTRWFLARRVEHMDEIILTTLFVAAALAVFAFRRWRETGLEMTRHYQVHAALSLLHEELDRRVQQRTIELKTANQALHEEIAERQKTMEALAESEEQFRQVVENIHEVFRIVDPAKGRVLYVSPTYEKIWGRSCESVHAEHHLGLDSIHPDDRVRIERAQREKQANGTYDEEFRIVRPDGLVRWIHDLAFPIRNAAGEVYRYVGVAEDVTDRKQLEEQYRQAQKMEAIGTLAGGIAHDFNNILGAIIGYTELADISIESNPKVHGYLGGVLEAARRATDLIRQILTFSRRQAQERRPIQLLPIVEETLKLLRATIPTTIEFETSLAENAPTVLADATQVHQILMNLGTNASYAMKSRNGRLQVTLERCLVDQVQAAAQPRLRTGVYARISVGDNGCGMDQATLRRVFEPFFTTKPLGEGTGLGLAVVHGIMDSHDGAITVDSTPGEGTTFRLYFPEHQGAAAPAPAKEGPIPRGTGESILVVDDEEVLAMVTQRALSVLGYEAVFETNPVAALELVTADPTRFALVIMDQTMPGLTGLQLAGKVRELRPALPMIIVTGYTAPLMAAKVKAAGIREMLVKPIALRVLGTAVRNALTAPILVS